MIALEIPQAKPGGNKRTVYILEMVNGASHLLSTGCQQHAIPKDLPAKSTVHDYLERWRVWCGFRWIVNTDSV
jgi:transposase